MIIGIIQDTVELQFDFKALQWKIIIWSIEFHPDKCKVFRITNKLKPIETEHYMNDHKLENMDEAKFPGDS